MNAKELLQINEQMMAFNTVMSGELKAELKAAKEALASLGSAQEISGAMAKLASARMDFDSYKATVQAIFDSEKEEIAKDKDKIKKRTASLAEKEESIQTQVDAFGMVQTQMMESLAKEKEALDKSWADFHTANAKYAKDKVALVAAQEDITAREAKVQAKLNAIASA